MKIEKEQLIKHRFWIVLGVFVPLFLVVLILLWTSVAGAIARQKNDVKRVEDGLTAIKDTRNPECVHKLEEGPQKEVGNKKQEIWKNAWASQENMQTWPPQLKDKLKDKYFGDDIDENTCDDYRGDNGYKTQIPDIVNTVDPVVEAGNGAVQYLGGWERVLKRINKDNDWSERPTPEEIWLAQEDLWMYRGLLQIVRTTNDSVASFRNETRDAIAQAQKELAQHRQALADAKKKPHDPNNRTRRPGDDKKKPDPVAALEKLVKAAEGKLKALQDHIKVDASKGEIDRQTFTNATWRLELFLARDAKQGGKPALSGRLTNISPRRLPLGMVFRVSLAPANFDQELHAEGEPRGPGESYTIRPTPIKAIAPEGIASVRQVFDWRTVPIKRIDQIIIADAQAASARIPSMTMQIDPAVSKLATQDSEGQSRPSASMGTMNMMNQQTQKMGGSMAGTANAKLRTPNGLVRDRYLQVTPGVVRRSPVAMVLVIDQAYLQELLTAVANSQLRIQTYQVDWRHFPRGESIKPLIVKKNKRKPTTQPTGTMVPGNMVQQMGGAKGAMPPRSTETDSEDLSSNLLHVAVYGVASLYERYPPKEETAKAANPVRGTPAR